MTDNRINRIQFSHSRSKLMMQGQRNFIKKYITYFSVQTLAIGSLVAMYGVQAFSESSECTAGPLDGSIDVTAKMKMIFRACFFIHVFQFFNSAFIGPFFQVLVPTQCAEISDEGQKIDAVPY